MAGMTAQSAMATAHLLLLAGCGGSETTIVKTGDGEVRTSGDGSYTVESSDGRKAVIETGDGAQDRASAEAVAKLPAFAPAYPGAKIISTMAVNGTGAAGTDGGGMMVTMETTDPMDKVVAFYDDKISTSGQTAKLSATQQGTVMRGVETADGVTALVNISDSGDSRAVTITAGGTGG